jgi:hypothetical protein
MIWTGAANVEVGWAILKGLGAAAVLIAVCLALAALRPAHADTSPVPIGASGPSVPAGH